MGENEREIRRGLEGLQVEGLRKQREDLEREKVLSDALQKANKNLDELRKYFQRLEERLAVAASEKVEADRSLGKEKPKGQVKSQRHARKAAAGPASDSAIELTNTRGFLGQLTRGWQAFRSQILQQGTQVFSGELEEKHERWLSCQKRCDSMQEQLSSWRQREEQRNGKCCAAEKEVTRLREALEKVQRETRELWRRRT